MPGTKIRTALTGTAALALATVMLAGPATGAPSGDAAIEANPCTGPEAGELLCPDLRVGPAADLYVERSGGYGGSGVRLHAENDIRSRGRGPMELRARLYKPKWMRANQAIYRVGGGVKVVQTEAKVHFVPVGYDWGGPYWKVHDPLSMEIWSLDESRQPLARVRKGPKVYYCFRDLIRTKAMARSPRYEVYPGCSEDPSRKRVTLGTSVGWSDIYPSDYSLQWVDVSGLRGCFAFVMVVDPENFLFEESEGNNRSTRIIRLPYRDGPQGC